MMRKRCFLTLVLCLSLSGCLCTTKEQHRAITESFATYIDRTEQLVADWAESARAEEVKAVRRQWFLDAKSAVAAHRRLSEP